MDWLSRFFNKTNKEPKGPPVQEVEVHFSYGSTNLQYLFALDDVLRHSISDAAVGVYDGHDISADGNDGVFYFYGPDAEAIHLVIAPILAGSSFMHDATITLWFGPKKWRTPKRVIHLAA